MALSKKKISVSKFPNKIELVDDECVVVVIVAVEDVIVLSVTMFVTSDVEKKVVVSPVC